MASPIDFIKLKLELFDVNKDRYLSFFSTKRLTSTVAFIQKYEDKIEALDFKIYRFEDKRFMYLEFNAKNISAEFLTILLITLCNDFKKIKIIQIHIKADIQADPIWCLIHFDPGRFRKTITCRMASELDHRGHRSFLIDIAFGNSVPSNLYGGLKSQQLFIYSASERHPKEYKKPTTRFERRYNSSKYTKANRFGTFQELLDYLPSITPFHQLRFLVLDKLSELTRPQDRCKADHYVRLIKECGKLNAHRELRKLDPQYLRTYEKILDKVTYKKIPLDEFFDRQRNTWVRSKLTSSERDVLNRTSK